MNSSHLCSAVLFVLLAVLVHARTPFNMVDTVPSFGKEQCGAPVPTSNFTYDGYSGFWYEIARIQTKGGAFFQRNCVCTSMNVTNKPDNNALAVESCREYTTNGTTTTVNGKLTYTGTPGEWTESFTPFTPTVSYTIVALGDPDQQDGFAVEYDCGANERGIINYCLHFMSRSPVMSSSLLNSLVQQTTYLNPQKIPLKMTLQQGCWDN
eukprot:TRINITY_DN14003_c0_g1_i1.p1 TRINITY_DN14003_c0_g1~~TRINITY_DN14003_c0_g1_i1.p1  ORF type:complete len:218 (-),score=100.09 TRINITY_DN14003_c0_g1_i1:43-669(-)